MDEGSTEALRQSREGVILRTILAACFFMFVGIALAISSTHVGHPWDAVLLGVGIAGITTATVGLAYEVWLRHRILAETLALASLSRNLLESGIVRLSPYREIDWSFLRRGAGDVDLFFTYGKTFSTTHASELMESAVRDGRQVRVVVLHPEAPTELKVAYARSFGIDVEELDRRVREVIKLWRDAALAAHGADRITIEGIKTILPYTFYRWGNDMWVVLNVAAQGRVGRIPAVKCSRTGRDTGLFDWVETDIGNCRTQNLLAAIDGVAS